MVEALRERVGERPQLNFDNEIPDGNDLGNNQLGVVVRSVIQNHQEIRVAVRELSERLQSQFGNGLDAETRAAIEKLQFLSDGQQRDIRKINDFRGGYNHRAKGRRSRKKGRSVSLRSKSKPRSRTRSRSKRSSYRSK